MNAPDQVRWSLQGREQNAKGQERVKNTKNSEKFKMYMMESVKQHHQCQAMK